MLIEVFFWTLAVLCNNPCWWCDRDIGLVEGEMLGKGVARVALTGVRETNDEPGVECSVCASLTRTSEYQYLYEGRVCRIYSCPSCTHKFLSPLPLADINERMMDSVDDAELFNSKLLRVLHERLIVWPEIRKVRSLLDRSVFSMLDVGCGTGWISQVWADSGAIVTGLEPSQARADIARRRGIRVLQSFAEEMGDEEKFDLIVIRHVVEHLEKPAEILKSLLLRLNSGGKLLIVVPNINCIGRVLFDADWTWVLPWHCNFFNPKSLQTLIDNCGYKSLVMYQTPSPLWYPESFVRKFPRLGAMFGTNPLSMLLFTPVIGIGHLFGWSDNITIIAGANREASKL